MNNTPQPTAPWEIRFCRGTSGCPNALDDAAQLAGMLERTCRDSGLEDFVRSRVQGPLKRHHQFRIALSCCPNGCTQPQIADIGLLGAGSVTRTREECTQCAACVQACTEQAVVLTPDGAVIDRQRCLHCGQCARACPTGTLELTGTGWRVQLGGRLGRHPRLGRELKGILSEAEVLEAVQISLEHFIRHGRPGERLGDLLSRRDLSGVRWRAL